jgi:hypothetical protein
LNFKHTHRFYSSRACLVLRFEYYHINRTPPHHTIVNMIMITPLLLLGLSIVYAWIPSLTQRSDIATSCKVSKVLFASSNALDDCGKCPSAPKCSGEYLTKGCDGLGKIQGGIATVPFFTWWPIKVFRPCPSYLQAGYQYKREGQTMDQVLFSEPSNKMKEKMEVMRKLELEKLENERDALKKEAIDIESISDEEKFLQEKFPGK